MNLTIAHQGFAKKIICNAKITSIDSGKSIKVTAMWNTGATRSLINDGIIKRLQLKAINLAKINVEPIHIGRLHFPKIFYIYS